MRKPNREDYDTIKSWPANDLPGLLEYIEEIWKYADCGYFTKIHSNRYKLSTAGWSDNEEIIAAMQSNVMWWMMYWESSRRGGHYVFAQRGK